MSNYIVRETKTENQISSLNNECFICYEDYGDIIYPCKCRGTNKGVHKICLEKWIKISKKDKCQVCKYKYKYTLIYEPSLKEFLTSCIDFDNIVLGNNNSTLFIAFIIISTYIILLTIIISIIQDPRTDIIMPIFSSALILKIIGLKIYDRDLNLVKILKYAQIFLTVLMYAYLLIRLFYDIGYCDTFCIEDKKKCDSECEYYDLYIYKKTVYINTILYQGAILSLCFLVDLYYKIKKCLYTMSIEPYTENSIINNNQVAPLPI